MKTALIASALVLVTALAFASGVQMDEDATGPQMSPGSFGKYDPPIEVSFVGCLNESMLTTVIHEGNSLEENVWTRAFVDRLGIQITWSTTGSREATKSAARSGVSASPPVTSPT